MSVVRFQFQLVTLHPEPRAKIADRWYSETSEAMAFSEKQLLNLFGNSSNAASHAAAKMCAYKMAATLADRGYVC